MTAYPDAQFFLPNIRPRRWGQENSPEGLTPQGLWLAESSAEIEVVFAAADSKPRSEDLRKLWAARWAKRPSAVLLVAGFNSQSGPRASVVGLRDKEQVQEWPLDVVRRAVQQALRETSHSRAEEALRILLQAHDPDAVVGLDNQGLFATHELRVNVPQRSDWAVALEASPAARNRLGSDLLSALGWSLTREGSEYLLGGDGRHEAVAVVLEGDEVFDRPSNRFGQSSPVEQALAVAHRNRLRWVLALQGPRVRLYTADPDTGIARKGTATYTQLDLSTLAPENWGYISLLLTPAALTAGGSVDEILAQSADHATSLGVRLRDRVYNDIVPGLAQTVARQTGAKAESELTDAYHQTLIILFRLLFVAYGEDRGLLPYRTNQQYQRVALKTRAKQYAAGLTENRALAFDDRAVDIWQDLQSIWAGVHDGHMDWGIPAYGGSLFAPDDKNGAAVASIRLTNNEIGPILVALLVDAGSDGTQGPVDFQTVSVREFGTIYEGLLESSLSIAPSDLALDPKTLAYVPVTAKAAVVVRAGDVYFHNASGVRKSTGSYFTKPFAVEHLLESALDPTLDEHLERVAQMLSTGDAAGSAAAFFDFRVADLAMGSGHFLVGAIDHIASKMSAFLTTHPLPEVTAQLELLRGSAQDALQAAGVLSMPTIDQMGLIRRQVARRCIYGVDINRIAVDLARLAVWIHTFIPGLPMSTLDHGLIVGSSLTGIGTLSEAIEVLEPSSPVGQFSLFRDQIESGMAAGAEPLRRVGLLAEANIAESKEAAALINQAHANAEPTKLVLDAAVAGRLGQIDLANTALLGWDALVAMGSSGLVRNAVRQLQALHFPVVFPEVFLRDRPGFDVMLGNPPWEAPHVKADRWWNLRSPGLLTLDDDAKAERIEELSRARPELESAFQGDSADADFMRSSLLSLGLPGLGSGHVDLYQVFAWRNWHFLRSGGRAGVVFPRSALSGSALAPWRREVLRNGGFPAVCFIENQGRWAFDMEPRYTVALTVATKGTNSSVGFAGPFANLQDFVEGVAQITEVPTVEFISWTKNTAFLMIPDGTSVEVFRQMKRSPPFDGQKGTWALRPTRGDFLRWQLLSKRGGHLVEIRAGRSFDIWNPDAGSARAEVSEGAFRDRYFEYLTTASRNKRSAHYGRIFTKTDLPIDHPRIALRWISRATDSRTCKPALLPPGCATDDSASVMHRLVGSARHEAYVLGVLSSIPFDWQARLLTEMNLTFEVLNQLSLPECDIDTGLGDRVVEIAGKLAAVDDRYTEWAAEVGVPFGSVTNRKERDDLIAELDALVGLLYGLARQQVEHVFETFHRGWDYKPRLTAVLAHFDKWRNQA